MTFQVDVYGFLPKCAGGTAIGGIPDWEAGSYYSDALDGTGGLLLVLPDSSPSLSLLTNRRIVRLAELPETGSAVIRGEWRIHRVRRSKHDPRVTVECKPLLDDLAMVPVAEVLAGAQALTDYQLAFVDLTPAEYFANVIRPALVAKGYTWINAGTFTPTGLLSLDLSGLSCREAAQLLVDRTDYTVRLRPNGDTEYLFDIVELGATAAPAVISIGRNVRALDWTTEGSLHATAVRPIGITPAGETEGRGPEEYAATVATPSATGVTLYDWDNSGFLVIQYDDQEVGHYLELLIPPIRLSREDQNLGTGSLGWTAYASCLRSTGSTRQICCVATRSGVTNGWLMVYDALTRAFVKGIDLGVTGSATNSVCYHPSTDLVYVTIGSTLKVVDVGAGTIAGTTALGTTAQAQAYAASSDKIYILANAQVYSINKTTYAVAATIGTSFNTGSDIVYDSTNDRIVASGTTVTPLGSLKFINPNTDTVADTLSLTPNTNANGIAFCDGSGKLYVASTNADNVLVVDGSGTPAISATLTGFVNPTHVWADQVRDEVWVLQASGIAVVLRASDNAVQADDVYVCEAAGIRNWGHPGTDLGSEQGLWWVPIVTHVRAICGSSRSLALRRVITDSVAIGGETTIGTVAPIVDKDLVSFRLTDGYAGGQLQTELVHPTRSLSTAYGYLVRKLLSDRWRGERNYVLNAYGNIPHAAMLHLAPGWMTEYANIASTVPIPHLRVNQFDASGWTTFAAQANGNQTAGVGYQVLLKAMTPGDVIQVGSRVTWAAGASAYFVAQLAIVDGSGHVTLALTQVWANSLTNGDAITVERPAITAADFEGDSGLGYKGGSVVVQDNLTVTCTNQIGVDFPLPSITGRSSFWVGVRVLVWRYSNFVPNTHLRFELRRQATVLQTTQPSDTNAYSDKAVAEYILWMGPFTPSYPTDFLSLRIYGAGTNTIWAGYVAYFMAVIGAEGNLEPFRINASLGQLYHAGQRAVRDLSEPPIHFELEALEDDPAVPFVLGGSTIVERGDPSLPTVTPRIVGLTRPLVRDSLRVGSQVGTILTLDNRPPSLARLLAQFGVSG